VNSEPQKDNSAARNKAQTTTMGRYMIFGMWIAAMVLATWLLHQHQEKLRNPNNEVITSTDGSKRSITLQRDRHAQYSAPPTSLISM